MSKNKINKIAEEKAFDYQRGLGMIDSVCDDHIVARRMGFYDGFKSGAKWQVEQFEKNRLAACEKQTKEEYDREMEFAASIIEKEHRQPTFSDAINYGIEWQKKQIPMPEDTVLFNKGIAEGKRLMKEEAVECSVYAGKEGDKWIVSYIGNYESMLKTCKSGDTVRIIILPKED